VIEEASGWAIDAGLGEFDRDLGCLLHGSISATTIHISCRVAGIDGIDLDAPRLACLGHGNGHRSAVFELL
jgi:hypothetical protein